VICELNVLGVFDTRIARARAGSASALALGLLRTAARSATSTVSAACDRSARTPDANGDAALDVSEASDRDGASATLDGAGLVDVAWADAASEADVGSASGADGGVEASVLEASIADSGTLDAAPDAADAASEATLPDARRSMRGRPGESACYARFAAA
jgi:hypothetical protein